MGDGLQTKNGDEGKQVARDFDKGVSNVKYNVTALTS
jgi:hypothetical protein